MDFVHAATIRRSSRRALARLLRGLDIAKAHRVSIEGIPVLTWSGKQLQAFLGSSLSQTRGGLATKGIDSARSQQRGDPAGGST